MKRVHPVGPRGAGPSIDNPVFILEINAFAGRGAIGLIHVKTDAPIRASGPRESQEFGGVVEWRAGDPVRTVQ